MSKRRRKLFMLGMTVFMAVTILCSDVVQATAPGGMTEAVTENYVLEEAVETEFSVDNNEVTVEENLENSEVVVEELPETESQLEVDSEETETVSMPTEAIWCSENFKVKHSIVNSWDGGYQGEVVITNLGDNTMEDWNLMFEMNSNIIQIWNASIDLSENNLYIIKNDNWNANISAGGSVSFGYVASNENLLEFPESYSISGAEKELAGDSYGITYEVSDMWEDGYVGYITITNQSEVELRNWKVSFELQDPICDIWNGSIHSNENGQYVIHCADYNAVIGAGETATIGFRVQGEELQMYPENYAVKVIVHSTMRTDLKDEVIGVAYYEELKAEDYRIADDGIQYVANQLNLVGKDGVTFEQIAKLGEEYEFEIVGYIEFTNDYQVKFAMDKTYEELNGLIAELAENELILEANLNLVSSIESDDDLSIPDDPEWSDEELWSGQIQDINWGVRAINAMEAWQYEEYMTPVKVGVFDNMFDESHEDLNFVKTWNNCTIDFSQWDDHGTHVAGTMAAEHDNGEGISGVAIQKELYAYAYMPEKDEIANEIKGTAMEYKYAFALMIGRGVRVINISCNTGRLECFAASRGNENAIRYINANANLMDKFLQRLVDRGYDFVLVVSAGNVNNLDYIQDPTEEYGYRRYEDGDKIEEKEVGGVQARYNHFLSSAKESSDRIIVVGAYRRNGHAFYSLAEYSCIGERVDVIAPGNSIYSTVSENEYEMISGYNNGVPTYWSGTSMAAPHVSGVAALAYSVNSELSGPQVKQLIVEQCSDIVVRDYNDTNQPEYFSVDAERVVGEALEITGNSPILGENTGFVLGHVKSALTSSPIGSVDVCAYRYSTYSGNVGIGQPEDYQYITKTNSEGDFSLELDPGMYRIIITRDAYKPLVIDNYKVYENEIKYIEKILFTDYSISSNTTIKGEVLDALDGNAIENANVVIREGWNNYSGEPIKDEIYTENDGSYSAKLPVGYYTVELSKEGYINSYINIIAYPGIDIQTAVMSPKLEEGEIRVVLTWGDIPSDLDAHLKMYTEVGSTEHIYYNNRSFYDVCNEKYYTLDIDDTGEYGPETITFHVKDSAFDEFEYYVYNYWSGDKNELSHSGARVAIYYGEQEVRVVNVPVEGQGRTWNVFRVVDGEIIIENTIT